MAGKSGVDGREVRDDGDDDDGPNFNVSFGIAFASMLLLSALISIDDVSAPSRPNSSRDHSEMLSYVPSYEYPPANIAALSFSRFRSRFSFLSCILSLGDFECSPCFSLFFVLSFLSFFFFTFIMPISLSFFSFLPSFEPLSLFFLRLISSP